MKGITFLTIILVFTLNGCIFQGPGQELLGAAPSIFNSATKSASTAISEIDSIDSLSDPIGQRILEGEIDYNIRVDQSFKRTKDRLFREISNRQLPSDPSLPIQIGNYEYSTRYNLGASRAAYYRKAINNDGVEELILDTNRFISPDTAGELGALRISPSQTDIAFTLDQKGDGNFTLFTKSIKEEVEAIKYPVTQVTDIEWGDDGTIYLIQTENGRGSLFRLYTKTQTSPEILYKEEDPSAYLTLTRSRSGRFIFLNSSTLTTSDVLSIDLSKPNSRPRRVQSKIKGVRYTVADHDAYFIIMTNHNAANYKIITKNISGGDGHRKKISIPEKEGTFLNTMEVFKDYMVLFKTEMGQNFIDVYYFATDKITRINPPESICSIFPAVNYDYNSPSFRYRYSSPVTPMTYVQYDTIKMDQRVLTTDTFDFDNTYLKKRYRVERIFVKTADGAELPITLTYHSKTKLDGSNPLVLYGYGAYGIEIQTTFSPERLTLLDHGVIYAIAHVRGGGFWGPNWHNAGRLLNKISGIEDYLTAAHYLIDRNYTSKGKIVGWGKSAGGILVGAAINKEPTLFGGIILESAFLDPLLKSNNSQGHLKNYEFEEWGDPSIAKHRSYIGSYAPYENLYTTRYPNILLISGISDPIVSPIQSVRYIAKLREMRTDSNLATLKISPTRSHNGELNRVESISEESLKYAFVLWSTRSHQVATSNSKIDIQDESLSR